MKKLFLIVVVSFITIINAQTIYKIPKDEITRALNYAVKEKCTDESILKIPQLKNSASKKYDPNTNGYTLFINKENYGNVAEVYIDHEGKFDGCKKINTKIDEKKYTETIKAPFATTSNSYIFSKNAIAESYNLMCKDEFKGRSVLVTVDNINDLIDLKQRAFLRGKEQYLEIPKESDFELRLKHLNIPNCNDKGFEKNKILISRDISKKTLASIYYCDGDTTKTSKRLYLKDEKKESAITGRLVCKLLKD